MSKAELAASMIGLCKAYRRNLQHIMVEGDSFSRVIWWASGQGKVPWEASRCLRKVLVLVRNLEVSFSHVRHIGHTGLVQFPQERLHFPSLVLNSDSTVHS